MLDSTRVLGRMGSDPEWLDRLDGETAEEHRKRVKERAEAEYGIDLSSVEEKLKAKNRSADKMLTYFNTIQILPL